MEVGAAATTGRFARSLPPGRDRFLRYTLE
jgi:hypothetical protein